MKASEYTLFLSDEAEADLTGIYNYIAYFLFNVPAADALLNSFDSAFDNTELFPESHPFDKFEKGYRTIVVDNYIAFYKIEDNNLIQVYRILYAKMAYENKL